MKGREIVKTIMERANISNAQLAHRLGLTIPTMWDRINSKKVKDIPLSTLNEMVRAMDYKIVIVPVNKQVKEDEYIVTNEEMTKSIANVSETNTSESDKSEPIKKELDKTEKSIDTDTETSEPIKKELDARPQQKDEHVRKRIKLTKSSSLIDLDALLSDKSE